MANKAYPPSICPGIPRLGKCPKGWTTCTFGDILTVVERPVPVDDDTVYQLVTAKRNRGGIVPREQLKGREIKTQGQYTVLAGDFLIANRQIIHGACGIVPENLDGALVSGEYTVLLPKKGLYLPWLAHFAHTVHFQQTCFQSSIGVDVEKMVFKVDWWLKFSLHLPPLSEQMRTAKMLTTWDQAIEETNQLIEKVSSQKNGLLLNLLRKPDAITQGRRNWREVALNDILETHMSGEWGEDASLAIRPVSILRAVNIRNDGRIDLTKMAVRSIPHHKLTRLRLVYGNILLEKSGGSPDQPVGRVAWFNLEGEYAFSNFIEKLVIKSEYNPEFVFWSLFQLYRSGKVRQFQQKTTGIINLQLEAYLRSIKISIPKDISEQKHIAKVIRNTDNFIVLLEMKKQRLLEQRKGLLRKLLTGDVRVKTTGTR